MKRSIILKTYAIFAFVIFLTANVVWFLCTKAVFPTWFSLGCFFIGSWCLLKAYFFNLDSQLWFGLTLILFAVVGYLNYFGKLEDISIAALYFLCIPVASIITGIFYKKLAHYKISFILILEDFLILLYSIGILNLLWFIIFSITVILLSLGGQYVFTGKRRLQ